MRSVDVEVAGGADGVEGEGGEGGWEGEGAADLEEEELGGGGGDAFREVSFVLKQVLRAYDDDGSVEWIGERSLDYFLHALPDLKRV